MLASRIEQAVHSLYSFISKSHSASLTDEPESIWLAINLCQIGQPSLKPRIIPLPFSPYNLADLRVCFISRDEEKPLIKSHLESIPHLSKVLSVKKLMTNYRPYEDKRKLLAAYDVFLCDDRVVTMLSRLLGSKFFAAKKQPIPVRIARPATKKQQKEAKEEAKMQKEGELPSVVAHLKAAVEKVLGATHYFLREGTCVTLRVGHAGQPESELIANTQAAADHLLVHPDPHWAPVNAALVPSNLAGLIQAMFVKGSTTPALQIYSAIPEPVPEEALLIERALLAPKPKKEKRQRKAAAAAAAADDDDDDEKATATATTPAAASRKHGRKETAAPATATATAAAPKEEASNKRARTEEEDDEDEEKVKAVPTRPAREAKTRARQVNKAAKEEEENEEESDGEFVAPAQEDDEDEDGSLLETMVEEDADEAAEAAEADEVEKAVPAPSPKKSPKAAAPTPKKSPAPKAAPTPKKSPKAAAPTPKKSPKAAPTPKKSPAPKAAAPTPKPQSPKKSPKKSPKAAPATPAPAAGLFL
ncbi:putative ribosomal protein L1 [Paratrimastix pyriformis]|uniref:Ribosomal protein L1 n=1 Tax=Paratrimastix pyriformis TaxID=342808 RepID=A0ABQ8UA40_9EUKA|nr:putative ribosomal protein L1 [Paratrimastix pyriformis]